MSVSVESSLQLSSNQKTLPTYIEIFTATPNKIESSTVKKIVSASVCKKNCAMSAEKYQPRLYNGRYRLLYLLFNPGIIFGICIRKCSIGVIRWCFIFKLRLVIFPGRRRLTFFPSVSVNHVLLPRLANVFLAKDMKTCRCRPKHIFGWGRMKKPSRPTL